jgi:multimeric flavodoxin WrbA
LYNKVAGCVVTGNEDGAHDVAANTLFNMTHLGCTVPPNVDTYWVGEAGPGPSFIEAGGEKHDYTQRTSRWTAHNLVHLARLLKEHPIPAEGNTFEEETIHHVG